MLNNVESTEDTGFRKVLDQKQMKTIFQKNLSSLSETNMYVVKYTQHCDVSRNLNWKWIETRRFTLDKWTPNEIMKGPM